ncbi:MAG TPA: hypothetical protein VF629_10175 [Hymenobacter sp.]|jgi:hypothetical protein|uniref:hypothetical protein n=1 Tax=Hymenobacter sp. TaxID=1898978 RepID=UPI002ED9FBC9
MTISFNTAALTGLLLTAAPAARAQSVELTMDNFTSSAMNTSLTTLNNAAVMAAAKNASGKGTANSTASNSASAVRLAYIPSTSARRAAVEAQARRLKASNPALAAKLPGTFGPGGPADFSLLYPKAIQGSGLRENDVADAFAAYLVGTYRVAHGEVPGGAFLPPKLVSAVRTQYAPAAARALAGRPASTTAELGEFLKLQTVLLYVGATQGRPTDLTAFRQGAAVQLKQLFKMDVNALTLTERGFVQSGAGTGTPATAAVSAAASPASPAAAAAPAAPSGTGAAAGAQWFFRSVSDAYGGIAFEPVALLASGQYCDVGDGPLETLNPAADKARRPAAWGTWRKNGNTVVLTNHKGQSNSYTLGTGSWFPAYAAGAVPLKRTYKNASGGSVGGATSLVISKINFLDGSHFSEGSDAGIVSANAAGGNRRSASGT